MAETKSGSRSGSKLNLNESTMPLLDDEAHEKAETPEKDAIEMKEKASTTSEGEKDDSNPEKVVSPPLQTIVGLLTCIKLRRLVIPRVQLTLSAQLLCYACNIKKRVIYAVLNFIEERSRRIVTGRCCDSRDVAQQGGKTGGRKCGLLRH